MTFYQSEIARINSICYSNKEQLNTVIATRQFINNNFARNLNLDLLSQARFTSKFHLLRLFKRYYGLTPKQYLISKRLEESKAMLRKGMSVSDTCYLVGFATPSSFSTLFKSRIGRTPAEYQKRATFTK